MRAAKKQQQPYDYMVKVVIIGDSAVGKTNILLRFVTDQYKMAHITTIGVDFKIKTISVEGVKLKMQIWDTAGQERFKTITETYYKGASGVLAVYSVNDRKTFNSIENWIKQINDSQPQGIAKMIIGNKSDVPDSERQVSKSEGQAMAKKFGFGFLETSAKDNININEAFNLIGKAMKDNLKESQNGQQGGGGGMKIKGTTKSNDDKKNCQC